jgi:hypothetical protein
VRYLSPAWFEAAGDALAADPGLPTAVAGLQLTLEQVVQDAPEGTVRWHLVIDDGVRLVAGPAEHADLRFTTSYATAAAIASGELAAQLAFIRGELRVGGDLTLLTTHQRTLAAIHDVLAEVRKATT